MPEAAVYIDGEPAGCAIAGREMASAPLPDSATTKGQILKSDSLRELPGYV